LAEQSQTRLKVRLVEKLMLSESDPPTTPKPLLVLRV